MTESGRAGVERFDGESQRRLTVLSVAVMVVSGVAGGVLKALVMAVSQLVMPPKRALVKSALA